MVDFILVISENYISNSQSNVKDERHYCYKFDNRKKSFGIDKYSFIISNGIINLKTIDKMKKLVLMLLLVASSANVLAQTPKVVVSDKDGWHKIGETTVSHDKEMDKIQILGANRFAAIKIKVTDAPIRLESFDIYFDNNEKKSVKIGKEIKNEGETSVVTFEGEKVIKHVDFFYHSIGQAKDKKAHVELWGLKTNPGKK